MQRRYKDFGFLYMLIQCTPLLVEKAGVTPDVTFRITACKQERVQARYPLWIWNPWGRTHEVQNRSNQWLQQNGPWSRQKNLKKKQTKIFGFFERECGNHCIITTVKWFAIPFNQLAEDTMYQVVQRNEGWKKRSALKLNDDRDQIITKTKISSAFPLENR